MTKWKHTSPPCTVLCGGGQNVSEERSFVPAWPYTDSGKALSSAYHTPCPMLRSRSRPCGMCSTRISAPKVQVKPCRDVCPTCSAANYALRAYSKSDWEQGSVTLQEHVQTTLYSEKGEFYCMAVSHPDDVTVHFRVDEQQPQSEVRSVAFFCVPHATD